MINILIVEDEPPIARDLAQIINQWEDNRYHIVDIVHDGFAAMKKIKEQPIEILLVDINMPGMSGLELISWIKEEGYGIESIIISGYNDFKYAQQAMSYGIKHYILKPIEVEELKQTMDAIKQSILLKQLQYDEYSEIIYKKGRRRSEEEPESYLLIMGCMGYYTYEEIAYDLLKKQMIEAFQKEELIENLLGQCKQLWSFFQKDGTFIIILSKKSILNTQVERVEAILAKSLESSNFPITYVISKQIEQFDEIKSRMSGLKELLGNSVQIEKSQIINEATYTEIGNDLNVLNKLTIDTLLERMRAHPQALELFLKEQLEQWKEKNQSQKYIINQLQILVANLWIEQNHTEKLKFDLHMSLWEAAKTIKYQEFLDNVITIVNNIKIKQQEPTYYETHIQIANRIEIYMIKHLTEPLNNIILSKEFGLTPAYISKIFKDYKGISTIDFIIEERMNLAKELLLRNPHLLTKEVASKVGYEDPYYFSKLFKKKMGKSPAYYKKK